MVTVYPANIDDNITLPLANDNITITNADTINRLRAAIIAIESELGVKPSSIYATVRARLDNLEDQIIAGGGFVAAGDLSGSPIDQIVVGLQGRPVANIAPTDGYVLMWIAADNNWEPKIISGFSGGITYKVTSVSTSTYVILKSDYILSVNFAGSVAMTLPSGPTKGDFYTIKDQSGNADINNITITPATGTIDGVSNYIISTNYQSVDIVYTGSEWSII